VQWQGGNVHAAKPLEKPFPCAGLLVIGGVMALVALITVGQGLNPAETLTQVLDQL
jgi:hypothetical protein